MSVEKVSFSDAEKINANNQTNALARANKSEDHFRTVEYNATTRGMEINKNKTSMICISAAKTYVPLSYLVASDGTKVESGQHMRILGFHLIPSLT